MNAAIVSLIALVLNVIVLFGDDEHNRDKHFSECAVKGYNMGPTYLDSGVIVHIDGFTATARPDVYVIRSLKSHDDWVAAYSLDATLLCKYDSIHPSRVSIINVEFYLWGIGVVVFVTVCCALLGGGGAAGWWLMFYSVKKYK